MGGVTKRIPELDGLRALAILAVFAGHALQFRMMWIGVDLFFVLSGFLITGILLDEPKTSFGGYMGGFYERRARRILPPYLLLLAVVTAVFGAAWMRHWYLYLGLMNYVGYFWKESPNLALGPLWSLAVEEQFYFFWPPIVFFLRARHLRRVLVTIPVAILVVTPLLRAVCTPWLAHQAFDRYHWAIYRGAPFRCDCLAAGALMTFLWRRYPGPIRQWGYLGLIPAALTPPVMIFLGHHLANFSTYGTSVRANVVIYEISLCAVTGLLLWALGGRFTAVLTLSPMGWLARLSYSFYLIHEALLELCGRFLHTPAAVAGVAGLLALLYAQISWSWMERPILHGGNRKLAEREVESAQPHAAQGESSASAIL